MNLLLQATREGLYAHPMAGFNEKQLRTSFAIEDGTTLLVVIALGYPGDGANLNEKHAQLEQIKQSRFPMDNLVQWNTWTSIS